MHKNRIIRFLNRLPPQPPTAPQPPADACCPPHEHFALLPLVGLPPAIQQAAAQQAGLYRWAYEQALGRRLG